MGAGGEQASIRRPRHAVDRTGMLRKSVQQFETGWRRLLLSFSLFLFPLPFSLLPFSLFPFPSFPFSLFLFSLFPFSSFPFSLSPFSLSSFAHLYELIRLIRVSPPVS